jgi:type I restriction enzyme, S subunit
MINYKYIELANIGSNGVIEDIIITEGKDLPSRARRIVKTNDVIVSSVEGSLSSCAIIPKELNDSMCSTGFYVINSKYINSESLLLLFKSAVTYLMEKGCSGTILTAINNEEFYKIPLPLIDDKIQKTIAKKIQSSLAMQSKSHQLLEAAKKAVEIAIDKNEGTAMDFLKNN